MLIRQISIENLLTGKKSVREVTDEQHRTILLDIATTGSPFEVKTIKEREL